MGTKPSLEKINNNKFYYYLAEKQKFSFVD
jgi:hypothetical protein